MTPDSSKPLLGSEFPGNSSASKAAKRSAERSPRVSKVVQGDVTTKPASVGRKFVDTFITGDDTRTVVNHLLFNVGIPGIRDLIFDMFVDGAERRFYGDSRGRGRATRSSFNSFRDNFVNYQTKYKNVREGVFDSPRSRPGVHGRARHNFEDIVLSTRVEADAVMSMMSNVMEKFDYVTVADLYDAVGLTAEITDESWGWTDLTHASVKWTTLGYILVLPRPIPIGSEG